ncbi:MAG: carbonic anhydrase [Rhodospirillales bacterium]|tara:strand:+ start:273 stop:911 length:639 start_codon:yes stop_codon:yes gene_type:complete
MTTGVDKLLDGYRRFRTGAFQDSKPLIQELVAQGQRPQVAVVACSDSRVEPATLFQTDPGDLFMIRNVANLVPPLEEDGKFHGTSAALEFAVVGLGVKHVIVLGHAHCGGVKAMMNADTDDGKFTFVTHWVSMLAAAHRRVLATMAGADEATRTRVCEQNAVLVSLENLTTFPWVRDRVEAGDLQLHGWYIDIATADLSVYDGAQGKFEPVG